MTGFGLAKAQSQQSQIEISVRSVNGRFFEPRFHLPREYFVFESDLKKILQKYFDRGTVDVFISRKIKPNANGLDVIVNRDLSRKYFEAFKTIAKDLKIRGRYHVESVARLPDVMKLEEISDLSHSEKKVVLQTMTKACQAADRERKREGKSLKTDLEKLIEALESELKEVHSVREEANQNLLDRFEQRIKSRLTGVEIDSTRLSQEVVIQLEKSDINEELIRLKEHVKNYRQLISSTEAIGKKLDFYTQELLREVNTIGSKSSVSKLTQIVVQAKTLIERLREQVQNIE